MYGDKTQSAKKEIMGSNGRLYIRTNLEYYILKVQYNSLRFIEKKSLPEISKIIGLNHELFYKVLKKERWPIGEKICNTPIRYGINENFFEGWTNENAWVYGWFLSDGSIDLKRNHISFNLKSIDIEVLEKIKVVTKFEGNITTYKHPDGRVHTSLRICRKDLVDGLIKKGCPLNDKTNTYEYPKIPLKYEHHFLRGIFEGDGHIRANRWDTLEIIIASASYNFVKQLHKRYLQFDINTSIKTHAKGGSGRKQDLYTIVTKSNLDALKLCKLMYSGVPKDLIMNRKYDKFICYINEYYIKRNRRNKMVNSFIDELKREFIKI